MGTTSTRFRFPIVHAADEADDPNAQWTNPRVATETALACEWSGWGLIRGARRVEPPRLEFDRHHVPTKRNYSGPWLPVQRLAIAVACVLVTGIWVRAKTLDLSNAAIPDLQQAYADGLPSERVVEVLLRRIEAFDRNGPKLNAILCLNPRALEDARALDAERKAYGPRSALHGVPVLVKDNIDTFDLPTTGGARALAGTRPGADAFIVARLRTAGTIILAKTNLDEFARGATGTSSLGGQTLSPLNPAKVPGGSSTGSAVGVSALFGLVALGTETGSSIRNPAAKNGIVGFCPSEGLVSRNGIIPNSPIFDRAGVLARNVTDAALMMQTISEIDPGDLFTLRSLGHSTAELARADTSAAGLRGMRVGVLRQLFGTGGEDAPAVALVEKAIASLSAAGAVVCDPVETGVRLWERVREVSRGEGRDSRLALEEYFASRGPDFPLKRIEDLLASEKFLGRLRTRYQNDIRTGDLANDVAYRENYEARLALRALIVSLMDRDRLDVLVYPHETKPARLLTEEVSDDGVSRGPPDDRGVGKGNTISSATGLPTIVVPAGFNVDGIGVGIEFLGRLFDEATVIRVAGGYERLARTRILPTSAPLMGLERLEY